MALVAASCEKDPIEEGHSASQMETSHHLSTKIVDRAALHTSFPSFQQNTTEPQNTVFSDPAYDYTISEYGVYMESETYRSYTFRVTNTPEGGYVENLVFSQHKDSLVRVFLLQYDFTLAEKKKIISNETVSLEGKLVGSYELSSPGQTGPTRYTYYNASNPCVPSRETELVEYCAEGNHPGGKMSDGTDCPAHSTKIVVHIEPCLSLREDGTGGGGTPGFPGDPYNPDPYDPGNGGTYDPENDDVHTTPVISLPMLTFLDANPNFKSWWMLIADEATKAQIKDFLNDNNTAPLWVFDQEAVDFVMEIHQFYVENGINTDTSTFIDHAISAWLDGVDVDFTNHLKNYNFHAESPEILTFEQDYRDHMSQAEIAIFDNLSRFHQLDYLHSAYLAKMYANKYFPETPKAQHNGKGDAYRHCLWNALGTAKLGESLMEQLTNAHEIYDPGDTPKPLEKAMDLHNNQVGRNIGNSCNFMLMMEVKFAVEAGQTNYIYPTDLYSDVIPGVSQIIPTDQ